MSKTNYTNTKVHSNLYGAMAFANGDGSINGGGMGCVGLE